MVLLIAFILSWQPSTAHADYDYYPYGQPPHLSRGIERLEAQLARSLPESEVQKLKVRDKVKEALAAITECAIRERSSDDEVGDCIRRAKQMLPQLIYNLYFPEVPKELCRSLKVPTAPE